MILIGNKCVIKQAETSGHLHIATVATGAFFFSDDNDYSAYVGDGSNNPYLFKFYDSTGALVGTAYGGAVGGGETLSGVELLTDPGVEAWTSVTDLTNWTEILSGTSTVNKEAVVVNGGSFAARLDIDASYSAARIRQSITGTIGALYAISTYSKTSVTGKTIMINWETSVNITSTDAYAKYTVYQTAVNGAGANLDFRNYGTTSASTSYYFDDCSIQRVTDCPATGLLLYSTRTGSTQTMASTGAGDPNTITRVEVWSAQ